MSKSSSISRSLTSQSRRDSFTGNSSLVDKIGSMAAELQEIAVKPDTVPSSGSQDVNVQSEVTPNLSAAITSLPEDNGPAIHPATNSPEHTQQPVVALNPGAHSTSTIQQDVAGGVSELVDRAQNAAQEMLGRGGVNLLEDVTSVSVPELKRAPVGRPSLPPSEKKTERTFSMDEVIYKRMVRLSNMEGLRLDKNVSTSEIFRCLITFALAHVENETVVPTSDGLGLHIEGCEVVQ